ncbi:MAG: tyrosine-type recombinase/integrase [Chloroflexi bacterium]|nr:tyrosine-type recombinase/integrase [Chloroflexota bacterium]
MTTELTSRRSPAAPSELPDIVRRTGQYTPSTMTDAEHQANEDFLAGAYAENTSIAYRSQLKAWARWCSKRELSLTEADPDSLVTYIRERADGTTIGDQEYRPAKPNSLRVATAAISKAYEVAGLPDITKNSKVRDALRSHRNRAARSGLRVKQAEALTAEVQMAIRATALYPRRGRGGMETADQARRRGLVDIALVGLMRDCLLRRSEAASIVWSDISRDGDGSGRLFVGVSKTDQEGDGTLLFISRQTMRDLDNIRHLGDPDQPVFGLHPKSIGKRIAAAAEAAGMTGHFTGHSARVGMARDLARAGEELPSLMTAGRWKGAEMVARYIARESAGRGAVARYHRDD